MSRCDLAHWQNRMALHITLLILIVAVPRESGMRQWLAAVVGNTRALALAGRLIADGVQVVVMESTSDYVRRDGA